MSDFKIDEFTHNVKIVDQSTPTDPKHFVVTGDGVFDKLMMTAEKHLSAQFVSNRFRKEDYGQLYIKLYETTLQAALAAETEASKAKLYKRQIQGYGEQFKQQILKIMLDAWGVGFSVAQDAMYDENIAAKAIPNPMTATAINDLYEKYVRKEYDEPIYTEKNWVMGDDK